MFWPVIRLVAFVIKTGTGHEPKPVGIVAPDTRSHRAFPHIRRNHVKAYPAGRIGPPAIRDWRPFSGGNGADALLSASSLLTLAESDLSTGSTARVTAAQK